MFSEMVVIWKKNTHCFPVRNEEHADYFMNSCKCVAPVKFLCDKIYIKIQILKSYGNFYEIYVKFINIKFICA